MATIYERDDAPNSLDTRYTVEVGDTFRGTLTNNDTDLVRIELAAGTTYEFTLSGRGGGDRLDDPVLSLWNSEIEQVAYNDRYSHEHLDALIKFSPDTSGAYYASIRGNDGESGDYELRAALGEPDPVPDFATYDDIANQLTDGYWESAGTSRRSFDIEPGATLHVNTTALTPEGQQLARGALEAWTNVTGIDFRFTSSTDAHITFDDDQPGAWAETTYSEDRILSAHVNVSTDWLAESGASLDSDNFQTYIHEIGHALGLGHPGNYPVDPDDPYVIFGVDAKFANDSWQTSVMSYVAQTDNTNIEADRAVAITPMIADIIAVQNLYGVPAGINTGNTVYGSNSNVGGYLGDLFALITGEHHDPGVYAGGPIAATILDTGGTDTIDFRTDIRDQRIDLRPEGISDVFGLRGNLVIARDTVIEDYIAGWGDDEVTGNHADNRLNGRAGNDRLDGGAGADTLGGGSGQDVLDYSWSPDAGVTLNLATGAGSGGHAEGDRLTGIEDVIGSKHADYIAGNNGPNKLTGGVGGDHLIGSRGTDWLVGNAGRDTRWGGRGNDTLWGGLGDDRLVGGAGDDRLTGGAGNDRFVFHSGHGNDTINGFTSGKDIIDLSRFILAEFSELNVASDTSDAAVDLSGHDGGTIFLGGIGVGSLDKSDFLL